MFDKESLKTFFLFPQKMVFEELADALVADQNEAFVLNNHVEFKDALRIFNKNSLAFINIDSLLSETEWVEYIRSIRNDNHFSNVKIGILSFNNNQELINRYKNELKIDCGYHILSLKNKKYEEDILTIVKKYKSKDKSKLLRLDIDRSIPMDFMIKDSSQFIKGRINSLSTAAISVTLDEGILLKKGTSLENIHLTYFDQKIKLKGTVLGNAQTNKAEFIIKFDSLYNEIHSNPIFKLIHSVLDNKMKEMVK